MTTYADLIEAGAPPLPAGYWYSITIADGPESCLVVQVQTKGTLYVRTLSERFVAVNELAPDEIFPAALDAARRAAHDAILTVERRPILEGIAGVYGPGIWPAA